MDDATNYVPLVEHTQDRVPAHEHVFQKLYLVGITRRIHCILLQTKMESIVLSNSSFLLSR